MATDDKRQTLDIPNGTTFEFKDGKLIFGHETDIVIRTNMGGYKFQKIFSKRGNVQVIPPEGVEFDVDEIEAHNGDVYLNGRVKARSTRGKTVHFQEGRLTADYIEAREEAVLAGNRLHVLHVKAPRVVIDADSEGLCLVVESQNEIGRVKARGGFRSLDEAREAMDQFRRLMGETGASTGQGSQEDANMTYPGIAIPAAQAQAAVQAETMSSGSTAEMPVLPKSSVFRKRS